MIIVSPVWVLGLYFYLTSLPSVLFLLGNMMFFSFLNALLIDDKQFFIIGMINSLSSIWMNF